MPTKKEIAFIRSLSKPGVRKKEMMFTAEGYKSVVDLLPYFACNLLVVNKYFHSLISYEMKHGKDFDIKEIKVVDDGFDFGKISNMKTPQGILAVFQCKEKKTYNLCNRHTYLFLEDIQDPGNMGTIIRSADWFGANTIFVTKGCVDVYNSKVVQSTMGSLGRVDVIEIDDAISFFKNTDANIFGTFLDDSHDINKITRTDDRPIILVMGNEGNGISTQISEFVNKRITIPLSKYRIHKNAPDSLNVSVATAIALFKLSAI